MMATKGEKVKILLVGMLGVCIVVLAGLSKADASIIEDRLAEHEQRRADLAAGREQDNNNQSEESPEPKEDTSEAVCACSARLDLGRPNVYWSGQSLKFVPSVDVSIRTRDIENAPDWSLKLDYHGVAHNTSYSGSKSWGGQCYDGRYTYTGIQLPDVTIADLLKSMFGEGDGLKSIITMHAVLSGCDVDEEHRLMKFEIKEFGNLNTGSWRRVR